MHCLHCKISRDYYSSDDHASRQNCIFSDSGYHSWVSSMCCLNWFRRDNRRGALLVRRRIKRPHTI